MVVSKQRNFEETKRTPHYGLRKLNVGVASVLLGVTVFGINVALKPSQAAASTMTPTESSATSTSVGNPTTGVTPGGETPATSGSGSAVETPTSGTETPAMSGQNPGTVDENHINT